LFVVLAAVTLLAVFLVFSYEGASASPSAADNRTVEEKLADIKRRLEETDRNTRDLLQLIQESDRRLQELNSVITSLEPRVQEATSRLDAAQAELDQATSLYLAKVTALEEVERRYGELRQRMALRIRRAYKDGPFAEVALLLAARSLTELESQRTYLDAVVRKDRQNQEELAALRDRLEAERMLVEQTKDELLQRRNAVQAATDEVVTLYKANIEARDLAERELANHRELLAMVLADRQQAIRMLDELDGISERTKQELLSSASRGDPAIVPGYFIWPADGKVVSGFGPRKHPIAGVVRQHNGVDIDAPYGAPVYAAASGRVLVASGMGGYGLTVVIDHGDGLSTLYAHLSQILVDASGQIQQGAVIGKVGSTGYSTGPHLHFEIRINGEPRDPLLWFPEKR
jgi:murein DD-endopeptidase MepM/ murein hydrolase activator NlpD